MQVRLFLIAFIICFTANPRELEYGKIYPLDPPVKKVKSKFTKNIKSNGLLYFNNRYKVNTFCRLVQIGNYNAVKNCITKGNNVNEISNRLTPLMYAARHNRTDIVKLLIENGANLKTRTCQGFTALKWAKLANATESYNIIQEALKKNIN
jgi:ankyrin repeat protein